MRVTFLAQGNNRGPCYRMMSTHGLKALIETTETSRLNIKGKK